jgi:phage gpG-like protein
MARIKLIGDFARIERQINKLGRPQEALKIVSEAMADESLTLVNECFADETDPYGQPWEPLKLRVGKILQDRGGMAASWHRKRASSSGFRIGSGKAYTKFHQGGTGIYGPRKTPIVPINGKALAFSVRTGTQVFGRGGKRLKSPKALNSKFVVRSVKGSPRRRMVPDPGPIPTKWRQRFHHAARDALKAHFA